MRCDILLMPSVTSIGGWSSPGAAMRHLSRHVNPAKMVENSTAEVSAATPGVWQYKACP